MAVIRMNYRSSELRRSTDVILILPTSMSKSARPAEGAKYPVLWLLHGGISDGNDFLNYSNVVGYAEDAQTAVVIPTSEGYFFEEPYYTFVTEELPRLLRFLYPLSDKREENFIGGLSHGGDCSMRAALEHPDRYAAALIMSAAGTEHHGEVGKVPLRFDVFGLAEKDLAEKAEMPRLIFATGGGDRGFPFYTPIIDRLEAMGIAVEREFEPEDGHSWGFWDRMLKRALGELFGLSHKPIFTEE